MKVCSTCGDTYQDYVDFCFNDGEVLVEAEVGAVGSSAEPRRATPAPSMMATPVPRDHRRSPPRPGRPTEPQRGPNVPAHGHVSSSAVTVPDDDGEEEAGPSAASLAMTQPIEIAGSPRGASGAHAGSGGSPGKWPASDASHPRPQSGQARGAAAPAPTFESELDEPDNSRLLLFGIAAALFGVFLLVAAGAVVVGTTTGMFGSGPSDTDVAVAEPPLPAPLPRDPLPSLVEPEPIPAPEPVEAAPQPAPVAPTPAPAPAPVAPVAPAPVVGEPEIPPPAPEPVPLPRPVVTQLRPAPAPGPRPVAPVAAPAPVVAAVARQPVSLATDPPGAAVYLGGSKVLAATPGTIELEPGTYTLEARLANHRSSTAAVTVGEGPVTASFAPLAPVPMVRVTVMWTPAKDYPTEVTVDGAKIGCPIPCTTPMTSGDHVLRVVNVDGSTFEKSVTIGSGPTAIVTLP